MANDTAIAEGPKVIGSGHFKGLKGRVIDSKESGFGMKYVLVKPKGGGEPQWARTIYLSPRD